MRAMFDTMVIVNAVGAKPLAAANPTNEILERSRKVLEDTPIVRVSAITWLEIKRRVRSAAEISKLNDIEKRMFIDSADVPVVTFAAELQRKRVAKWSKDVCVKCGNSIASHPCAGCNLQLAEKARFDDYLIAATAHVKRDVTILYTFDASIISMKVDLRDNLEIKEPPNVWGPLFGRPQLPPKEEPEAANEKP